MQIHDSLRSLAVKVSSLTPDPANARKHGTRNLAAIQAALAKFGQLKPIVVQRQGMIVRAGNGTLAAAIALGAEEIAAVVNDMTDDEAKAYAIADNRTAELAEWDDKVLGTLLAQLNTGVALDATLTGFNTSEIAKLSKFAAQALPTDIDVVPDPPTTAPVTKLGDLWLLGKHRLMCGDSTDPPSVLRLVDVDAPELLTTDPPYGVSLDMEWRDRAGMNKAGPAEATYMRGEGFKNTSLEGDTKADWSDAFEIVQSLKIAYVWHASRFAIEVGLGLRRIGFELKQQIIWRKPCIILGRQHYQWQHEPCWYARKPGSSPFLGSKSESTIWDAPSPKHIMQGSDEDKCDHPTQKPVLVYTKPIENHTRSGDAIYEPFGGSGTAIAAAEVLGRRCLAMELDPKYCDVIVERWQKLSGGKAQLQRGGKIVGLAIPTRAAAAPKPKSRKKKP